MDQTDFRKLVATPKPGGSSGSSGSGGASSRTFGASNKRKADPTNSNSSKASSYDFKPRKTQKTTPDGSAASNPNPHKPKAAPKNSTTGESYTDRAEARRKGLDDEFAEVERLREEFQKRAEGGEIGKEELEEQMRFLGGDAKHSILVKGLDYALLAQNKAKAESNLDEGNIDDDLEAAFESSKSKPSSSSSSSLKDRYSRKDSLLEAIKKNKESRDGQKEEEIKKNSKFKPIGFKKVEVNMEPQVSGDKKIGKDGKKLRKKKKKPEVVEERNGETSTNAEQSSSKVQEQKKTAPPLLSTSKTSGRPSASSPPTTKSNPFSNEIPNSIHAPQEKQLKSASNPITKEAEPEAETIEEDDVDIFSDAGSWKGLPLGDDDEEDNDSEQDEKKPDSSSKAIETSSIKKRDWFSTSKPGEVTEENKSIEPSTLPGHLGKVISSATSKRSPESNGEERDGISRSRSPSPPSENRKGMRLQGLSDSNLPGNMGKLLLQHDLQREKRKEEWEKKNRAKKAKEKDGDGEDVEGEEKGEGEGEDGGDEKIGAYKGKSKKGKGRRRRDDDDDD